MADPEPPLIKKPSALKALLAASLYQTRTGFKNNLKTAMAVTTIQAISRDPNQLSVSTRQALSGRYRPPKGPTWAAASVIPVPATEDTNLLEILMEVIREMGEGTEEIDVPEYAPIEVEWVGYRKGVGRGEPQPKLSEEEIYKALCRDTESDVTILYVHGGGFFQGSLSESRSACARLARSCGGKCLSVGYRLSPQHPFPSALLDVLLAYISLLHPDSSSFHDPIPASKIVLCGDSSGGGLCLSLLQVILQLHRRISTQPTVRIGGKDLPLAIPAGLSAFSPYGDLTHSLPSWNENYVYDYFPPIDPTLAVSPPYPSCPLWPSPPPRANFYCHGSALCHPLVSPVMAEDWEKAGPMWMAYGQEQLLDEGRVLFKLATASGVPVVWEYYEAMPHAFPTLPILRELPQADRAYRSRGEFCKACVQQAARIISYGTTIESNGAEQSLAIGRIPPNMTVSEVQRRIKTGRAHVQELFRRRLKLDKSKAKL